MKHDDSRLSNATPTLDYQRPDEIGGAERLSIGQINGAMIFGIFAGLLAILFLWFGAWGIVYLGRNAPRHDRLEDAPVVFVIVLTGGVAAFASIRWLRAGIRSLRR